MTNQQSQSKSRFGTIEGASFIISIAVFLFVFFYVVPGFKSFQNTMTQETERLQSQLAQIDLNQKALAKQICTNDYSRELSELRSLSLTLSDLEANGNDSIKLQAKETSESINKLISVLKANQTK